MWSENYKKNNRKPLTSMKTELVVKNNRWAHMEGSFTTASHMLDDNLSISSDVDESINDFLNEKKIDFLCERQDNLFEVMGIFKQENIPELLKLNLDNEFITKGQYTTKAFIFLLLKSTYYPEVDKQFYLVLTGRYWINTKVNMHEVVRVIGLFNRKERFLNIGGELLGPGPVPLRLPAIIIKPEQQAFPSVLNNSPCYRRSVLAVITSSLVLKSNIYVLKG